MSGTHADQPVALAGAPLHAAKGALILVHGRGGDAAGMLDLARLVAGPEVACLAPQAAGHTWYPLRFMEPTARNEPHLGAALAVLDGLVEHVATSGIPPGRTALLGFSQGACLALEFAARRGAPLGAVIGLSGGLIGPSVAMLANVALAGMPVLLGCSERDPHIPLARVRETEAALRAMGAAVVTRIYPGGGHDVNDDEIGLAKAMLAQMVA